jgi:hypothetical protein
MDPVLAFILGLAALVVAIHTIWTKAIRPICKAVKILHATYESVTDQGDRLEVVEQRSAELVNNSGSSLRDAVDRIETEQTRQGAVLNTHLDWAQDELLKVWQTMAAKDTVEAAAKAADALEGRD